MHLYDIGTWRSEARGRPEYKFVYTNSGDTIDRFVKVPYEEEENQLTLE